MAITVTAAHVAESFDSGNMKEDCSDIIFNIDPSDTPVLSNSGRRDVSNTTFEWNTESLPTHVSDNAKKEGLDFTSEAPTQVTRQTNITQISSRNATVSGTMSAIAQYGKGTGGEMAHQLTLIGKTLKNDVEFVLVSHNPQETGSANQGAARRTESMAHQIARGSNFKAKASSGTSAPGSNTASFTPGSASESLTETFFMDSLEQIFTNGGNCDAAVVPPGVKREISDFTGRSGQYVTVPESKISNNITVLASDFGDIQIMTTRNYEQIGANTSVDIFFADWEYLKVAFLRPFTTQQIAKQGDSDSRQIIVEFGAQVSNFNACGLRVDLTNTYSS